MGVLTITALWPVGILFMHLKTTLQTIKIIPKYAMYQVGQLQEPQVVVFYLCHFSDTVCVSVCVCVCAFVSAAGADPQPAAVGHHQHPGDERNHRLLSAVLVSGQRIQ